MIKNGNLECRLEVGSELAAAYYAGFQKTRAEFFSERTGGDICQLGHGEHVGSLANEITRGAGKDDGTERPACGPITLKQSARANYVADNSGARIQE